MASTVVYMTVDPSIVDRENQECSEMIVSGHKPDIGDELKMGSDRLWKVFRVEAYQNDDTTVYIASLIPADGELPSGFEPPLTQVEYPGAAFSVIFSPALDPITYAWEIQGQIPSGRLEGYQVGMDGQIESVPLDWVIDQVEVCQPVGDAKLFAAVNFAVCRKAPVPA